MWVMVVFQRRKKGALFDLCERTGTGGFRRNDEMCSLLEIGFETKKHSK